MNLIAHIKKFEIDNNLYENKDLSKVWKSIRSNIYYTLQKDLGVFSEVKPSFNKADKILSLFKVSINSVFFKPKINNSFYNLILQHPRTEKAGCHYIDPYSYNFTKEMAGSSLFLSRTSFGEIEKKTGFKQASLDYVYVLCFFKSKVYFLSPAIKDKISTLMESLCEPLKVNIKKYIVKFFTAYKEFKISEKYFIGLLRASSIKKLYLVDHYSKNVPLISACKTLGIEVLEFQHGIISNFHLGYSVASQDYNWPCYPDVFFSWGRHWLNHTELSNSIKVSSISPAYLDKIKRGHKKNTLLVISQSVIGEKLAKFLLMNVKIESFEKVIYKLHPSELDMLSFYMDYFAGSNIETSTEDIYSLLNSSKYVLGVFSTAMIEAIDFGCEVFYADLVGSEYIKNNDSLQSIELTKYYVS
jgi:hypothetical protein